MTTIRGWGYTVYPGRHVWDNPIQDINELRSDLEAYKVEAVEPLSGSDYTRDATIRVMEKGRFIDRRM